MELEIWWLGAELNCRHKDFRAPARQVLLVAQVLVRGHQKIEACLGRAQQVPVGEGGPSHLVGGGHGMARESTSQGRRGALVEKDLHERARARAFDNPTGWNALPASELDGCPVARARSERAAEEGVR